MTTVEMLRNWGDPQDLFQVLDVNSQAPDTWVAKLLAASRSDPEDLALTVSKASGDERIWLSLQRAVPENISRLVSESKERAEDLRRHLITVENARGSVLRCLLITEGAQLSVEIRTVVYVDGFSRHTLNAAVCETVKAHSSVEQGYEALMAVARITDQTQEWLKDEEKRMTKTFTPPPQVQPTAASDTVQACPSCGAQSPAGSRFCNQCGARLSAPRT